MLKKGGKFKEMGIIALFIVLALIPACFKKQAVLQRSSATTTASHEKILPDDPEGTDNAIKSIIFTDPKHGWAVGKKGSIFYTKNGGKVWLPQKNESKKETLVRVFLLTQSTVGQLAGLLFFIPMTAEILGFAKITVSKRNE